MTPELRETLGKAAYEAVTPRMDDSDSVQKHWNEVDARVREAYCIEAEAVVTKLAAVLADELQEVVGLCSYALKTGLDTDEVWANEELYQKHLRTVERVKRIRQMALDFLPPKEHE